MLDRADRVDGHRRGGDDRPTRLDAHLRPHAERVAGVEQHVAPLGDRRRLLALDVGHAEPAAEHQLGQVERHGEVGHHLGRLGEAATPRTRSSRCGSARRRARTADDRRARSTARSGVAVAEVEAELRVVLAGGDELVGVGVHAGRDPQQDRRARRRRRRRRARRAGRARRSESTTMWRTPLGDRHRAARRRSCCCRAARSADAGTPAASATCSSPPVATSSSSPSSYASRAIALHRNALVA